MKVLLIEDEPDLAEDISAYLSSEQIVCSHVPDLGSAREAVALYRYDLVILDVGLPDGSGLDLIAELLKAAQPSGILIVSAKNSLEDRLKGLDLGADDYLTKPFHMAELLSRLRSIFRRRNFQGKKALTFGGLKVYPDEHRAQLEGHELDLSPKEFGLLMFLCSNAGKVLPKGAIAEHLWGDSADQMDDFDFIYSHIKNLRKKLTATGATDPIKGIYGVGYKFEVE